jgi:hypothetical protein
LLMLERFSREPLFVVVGSGSIIIDQICSRLRALLRGAYTRPMRA